MATADTIVEITSEVSEGALGPAQFGRGGFYHTDETQIPVGTYKSNVYSRFADVEEDYASNSEPYKFARTWFRQPTAVSPLVMIRRRNNAVIQATGSVSRSRSQLNQATGTFVWANVFTSITLTAHTSASFDDFAADLESDINSGGTLATGVSKVHVRAEYRLDDINRPVLVFYAETTSTVATSVTAKITGNSLGGLGLDTQEDIIKYPIETFADSITDAADAHHWVGLENAWQAGSNFAASDFTSLNAALAATKRQSVIRISDDASLTESSSSSGSALLSTAANQSSNLAAIWHRSLTYPDAAIMAQYSAVKFNEPASLISIAFKQLDGIAVSELTRAQRQLLDSRRINYYVDIGGVPGVYGGWTVQPKRFIDFVYATYWYENEQRRQILAEARQARKIDLSSLGAAAVKRRLSSAASAAIANGFLAPGQLEDTVVQDVRQITGNNSFSGYLGKGYLIYIQKFSDQSQDDRDAGIFPNIYTWATSAGTAIKFTIANTLEQ